MSDECTSFQVTYTAAPRDGSIGSEGMRTGPSCSSWNSRTLGEVGISRTLDDGTGERVPVTPGTGADRPDTGRSGRDRPGNHPEGLAGVASRSRLVLFPDRQPATPATTRSGARRRGAYHVGSHRPRKPRNCFGTALPVLPLVNHVRRPGPASPIRLMRLP